MNMRKGSWKGCIRGFGGRTEEIPEDDDGEGVLTSFLLFSSTCTQTISPAYVSAWSKGITWEVPDEYQHTDSTIAFIQKMAAGGPPSEPSPELTVNPTPSVTSVVTTPFSVNLDRNSKWRRCTNQSLNSIEV